jgi:hypothetical protein
MASRVASGRLRSLAACGLAAPIVYTGAAFAASLKHPGYDHLTTSSVSWAPPGLPVLRS